METAPPTHRGLKSPNSEGAISRQTPQQVLLSWWNLTNGLRNPWRARAGAGLPAGQDVLLRDGVSEEAVLVSGPTDQQDRTLPGPRGRAGWTLQRTERGGLSAVWKQGAGPLPHDTQGQGCRLQAPSVEVNAKRLGEKADHRPGFFNKTYWVTSEHLTTSKGTTISKDAPQKCADRAQTGSRHAHRVAPRKARRPSTARAPAGRWEGGGQPGVRTAKRRTLHRKEPA